VLASSPEGTSTARTGPEKSLHLGLEARSQDCIDKEVAFIDQTPLGFKICGFLPDRHGHAYIPQDVEVGQRISGKPAGISQAKDSNLRTTGVKYSGQHKAVSRIVAGTCNNRDPGIEEFRIELKKEFGSTSGCVFHEHDAGYSNRINCLLIEPCHFRGGKDQHGGSS